MTAQQLPEAAVEAAIRAAYDSEPQYTAGPGNSRRPKTYEECYGCSPLEHVEGADEMRGSLQAFIANAPAEFFLSLAAERMGDEEREELIEEAAKAAFWQDDLGGHIAGRWTWDTIPDDGRENYRKMIRAALAALLPGEPRD